MRHASVVVHERSTTAYEARIGGKPLICMDPNQSGDVGLDIGRLGLLAASPREAAQLTGDYLAEERASERVLLTDSERAYIEPRIANLSNLELAADRIADTWLNLLMASRGSLVQPIVDATTRGTPIPLRMRAGVQGWLVDPVGEVMSAKNAGKVYNHHRNRQHVFPRIPRGVVERKLQTLADIYGSSRHVKIKWLAPRLLELSGR